MSSFSEKLKNINKRVNTFEKQKKEDLHSSNNKIEHAK